MEEIKDLGGLVNKDLAFSKLPQGAVFDSQNFRITTNDGNTSAARENIRGTTLATPVPLGACLYTILLNQQFLQDALVVDTSYTISFEVNSAPVPTSFVFVYQSYSNFLQEFVNYINTNSTFEANTITAVKGNTSITVFSTYCISFSILSFTTTSPVVASYFPYELWDREFTVSSYNGQDYNILNGQTSPKLWGLYGQSVISFPTSSSIITTGNILDYSGALLDNLSTNLRLDIYNDLTITPNYYQVIKGFHKYDYFASPIRGQIFENFPTGTYDYNYSFYVKKDSDVTGNVKLYAQLGSSIDSTIDPTITVDNIDGVDYVLIDTVPLLSGVTDVDYLDTLGGSKVVNFNYSKPLFGALGLAISNGGAASYRFDHAVVIETTGFGTYSDPSGTFVNNATWVDSTVGPAVAYYPYPGGNLPIKVNFTISYFVDPSLNIGSPNIQFYLDSTGGTVIDHATYCLTNGLPYTGNFSFTQTYSFSDSAAWPDFFPYVVIDSDVSPPTITNVEILSGTYTITNLNTNALICKVGFSPSGNLNVAFGSSEQWYFGSTLLGNAPYNATLYVDFVNVQAPPLNLLAGITFNNLSSTLNNNYIIGWVNLRDDIYIFTTDGTFNPDDSSTWGGSVPPNTTGQIWKLSYDKGGDYSDSSNYTISLVYSNSNLQFTTYRPIANPGMIESRYENSLIQKIYWTDNYNAPRQINVADPNVATLTVEQLNLLPSLSMDLPVFVNIQDGGSLKVGLYQVAYRLKNTNGSETRFSRTTNFIPVIDAQENNNPTVNTYYPRKPIEDNANKQITIRVDNIDTNYDTIEFVTLYYKDDNNQPEILIVKEAFISGSSVEVIITGDEDPVVPITIEEFTAFTTSIKRAKTLAAKKQTLFLANVTTGDQFINFDARTYRFPFNDNVTYIQYENNQTIFESVVYDSATGTFNYQGILNNPVPETHDCLQTYMSQGPTTDANYLFQPNSNILGGAGPNVKYEFFTENVKLDNKYNDSGPNPPGSGGAYGPHMYTDTNAGITFNSIDRTFVSQGTSLSNNASPYVYDLFVGYRRDEMYRFGIVFFDELDNPTYVSWIGDIRMPHIFMPDTCRDAYLPGAGITRTRLGVGINPTNGLSTDTTYLDLDKANNKLHLYGKPLGIKFTIDFSSVPSQYKKASIVRVPLKPEYKHVIGQGYLQPAFKGDGIAQSPYNDANTVFTANGAKGNYGYKGYNDLWYDCWTLASPEFLFSTFPGFSSTNELDVLGLLYKTNFAFLAGEVNGYIQPINALPFSNSNSQQNKLWSAWTIKNYQLLEDSVRPRSIKDVLSNNPYNLVNATILPRGGDGTRKYTAGNTIAATGSPGVRSIHNCVPKELAGVGGGLNYPAGAGYSYGNTTLFIQMNASDAKNWNDANYGGDDFIDLDGWDSSTNYEFYNYLGNYKNNVALPFGGQNYFARSSSEYVPCNNLIDISNKTAPISTKVLGGDTSVVVMDYVLQFFDRAEAGEFDNNNTVDIFFKEVYFPVETSIAVDYRRTYNNFPYGGQETLVPNKTRYLRILYGAGDSQWNSTPRLPTQEEFTVDPVFNHTDKSVYRYFPQPALIVPPTVYDCRIWKSEPKDDGELVESWSVFKPSAFKDVESAYGPINNLLIFQDKLFFFQDRGFGVVQVAAQQLLNSSDGDLSELVLGSSGILERYDYISTKTGTKHQFSMSVSDYSMIWFDSLARKIYKYSPSGLAPLSDLKGYSAYVYARTGGNFQNFDNPYIGRGIHSTYDYRHGEFYMTFLDDDFQDTLVYSDFFDGFVGSYTHYPKVYINDKVNIFGVVTSPVTLSDTIHIHNYGPYGKFYDNVTYDDSKVSFVVNSNPTIEKVFTNLEIVAESYKANLTGNINYDSLSAIDYTDFFDTIRVYDNYQNTNILSTTGLSRRHKTIWNVKVPSDRVLDVTQNIFDPVNLALNRPAITRRMKDKWFVVDLTYSNQLTTGQNKLVAHSAKALYSVNSR